MIKILVTWITLMTFFTQVAFANPLPTPEKMDKVLQGIMTQYQKLNNLNQIKEPRLKLMARALPKNFVFPKLTREGNVLRLDIQGKSVSLEFVDFNARTIKINNNAITLKSFDVTDVSSAVGSEVRKMKTSSNGFINFFISDAHALPAEFIVLAVFLLTILIIMGALLAVGEYIMNKPARPLPPLF